MPVWLDGERFESTLAPFDLADRGLMLGDGVFDTALALGGRIAFRDVHLHRLAAACATLGFPFDRARAGAMMDAAARDAGSGSVRLTATRGSGPRGLAPPETARPRLIASNAAGPPAAAFAPLRLGWSAIRRNETSPTSRLKTLNYLDAVLALGDARREGFDEALFLNGQGRVACAGAGNLFVLSGDTLATPPPADGVLPGITRAAILRLAARAGFQATERSLEPQDVLDADAAFVTNSLRLVAPVRAVGGHPFATDATAKLRRLGAALREEIARDCGTDAARALPLDRLAS